MTRDTLFLLIAIGLAVPLSIVANLLTPRLRDWWAATSKKRLINRIEDLEFALKIPSRPFEEVLLRALIKVAFGLMCLTLILGGMAVVVIHPEAVIIHNSLTPRAKYLISITPIFIAYMLAALLFLSVYVDFTNYLVRLPHSREHERVQLRIERLRKKLGRK